MFVQAFIYGPCFCVCKQRRLWRDCADAQARLRVRDLHMRLLPKSHNMARFKHFYRLHYSINSNIPYKFCLITINVVLYRLSC